MTIKLGNSDVAKYYIGNTEASKIYLGNNLAATSAISLEAPISSDIASLTAGSYGFDRLVEGFSGNTVRLIRTSDNVEADFGFNGVTGMFNYSAVDSWRASSDVNVVRFYNQSGGSVTLNASGTVTFVVSNVVKRFGTTYSDQSFSATRTSGSAVVTVASTTLMGIGMVVTGNGIPEDTLIETVDSATQITLSRNVTTTETSNIIVKNGQLERTNEGGVGCNLNGSAHFVTSTNLTLNTASGMGVTVLYSPNNRKVASNGSLIYGGNATEERVLAYGLGTNNFIRHRWSGAGTNVHSTSLKTSSAHTTQSASVNVTMPRYSQQVHSFDIVPASFGKFTKATKESNAATSAQAVTDIPNGTLNNGLLVIGSEFSTSGGAVGTTSRANMLFGGVVVHRALTALQRYKVINKFHAIGQQHKIMSVDALKALFSDIILHKNINTSTGIVNGLKSASTFNFNLPTLSSPVGTPTYSPNYSIPEVGITGLRTTSDSDNTFYSDDVTPPDLNGTIIALNMTEGSGTNLPTDLAVHSGSLTDTTTVIHNVGLSFSLGRDHNEQNSFYRPYDLDEIGSRRMADRTSSFIDLSAIPSPELYDGANQLAGKYNRGLLNDDFVYGEYISFANRSPSSWANHGANSLGLDAPVMAHIAENVKSLAKDGKLTLQICRFQAPAEYVKTDSSATRLTHSLKSRNAMFLSQSTIIGHQEGSICKTKYGGVVHNAPTAKFKSYQGIFQPFQGVRCLWAWTPNVLTDDEISKVDINLYKLLVA